MNRAIISSAIVALSAIVSTPALAAPSIGDTVTCTSNIFDCSTSSALVSSGTEFTLDPSLPDSLYSADFSAGLLTLTRTVGSTQNAFAGRVTFADTTSAFTDAVLTSMSGIGNFDQSHVSLTNGRLTISFGSTTAGVTTGTTFGEGASLAIRLAPAAAAVPELASWAMMVVGIGAVGFALRRRNGITTSATIAG